ncbi:endonuclease [Shewanella surugensis]|uniref:Endonuclease n=1 Tax=Shewanella surugensis TaxID=212020 RepID=A0ABT0LH31_9GAMM|nr:endonuclease [Shewanella surugensis]MCL1126980.1 endonuclease [Shewanella surugensis]
MKKIIILALSTFHFSATANVLISEVLYDSPNDDITEEWVELYNASCDTIDLSTYTLNDNGGNYALSGELAAGEYLTVAKDATAFYNLYGTSADLTDFSLSLGNSGDYLYLKNNDSEIDMLAWENKISGWNISATNTSLARTSTEDTDSVSDWGNTNSTGTPKSGIFSSSCSTNDNLATEFSDTEIANGGTIDLVATSSGQPLSYTLNTAAGSDLTIAITGGSGDADLYVKLGSAPTTSDYDCAPYLTGNNESCSFSTVSAGTYYINIVSFENFTDVTLSANYTEDSDNAGGGNTSFEDFDTYYADASNLTGETLKSALNTIIDTHTSLSYSQVWDALETTDEDPDNSGNVILFYTQRSQNKASRVGGAGANNDQNDWNREHIWPKSHGFPSSGDDAYTDIHHLRPSDESVNSTRGNLDFDDSSSNSISEAPGTYYDTDSFEPMDSLKGDVARMIFYMDVRYQGTDTSTTGVGDLQISNSTGTATSSSGNGYIGKLCTLLTWHNSDPVDSLEEARNNKVYVIQGNRNPFIDYADWANEIYTNQCN